MGGEGGGCHTSLDRVSVPLTGTARPAWVSLISNIPKEDFLLFTSTTGICRSFNCSSPEAFGFHVYATAADGRSMKLVR